MGSLAATPFGIGTPGVYPFAQQPYLYGIGGAQLLPQSVQLLQIVAQQLQQLQLLQQQQLAQLQQIQQLIHAVPQQWQPFGAGIASPFGFGTSAQTFGGQASGHVM